MKYSRDQQTTGKNSDETIPAIAPLRGRILLTARIAFIIELVLGAGMTIAGLPLIPSYLHALCQSNLCLYQLSLKQLQELQAAGLSLQMYVITILIISIVAILVTYGLAILLMWKRSDDRVALFMACALVALGTTLSWGSSALAMAYPFFAFPNQLLYFFQGVVYVPLFCLFPDGRFVPCWSGWVALIQMIVVFISVFFSDVLLSNPLLSNIGMVFGVGAFVFVAGTLLYRYRQTSIYQQRQQIRMVFFTTAIIALEDVVFSIPLLIYPSLTNSAYWVITNNINICTILIVQVFVVIAIMRYRLWNIDLLISKTTVYGLLTACVIGLYVGIVGFCSTLIPLSNTFGISLLATGVIAVLFQPLRHWLQRTVSRLLFGLRDDPYQLLSHLGSQLEATLPSEALLPIITQTVAQSLKFPFASISWNAESVSSEEVFVASYGQTSPSETFIRIPLVYQTETIGSLVLAPRQRGEHLTPSDQHLLNALAPQIGAAVHAMRLTGDLKQTNTDLQHSREQLVTTREEERRRLRRDLHDGLGPTLAALNLQVGSLRTLIVHNPVAADALVVEWRAHLRKVIADVRSLVYALRPPALDELGLLGALREQINQYRSSGVKLTLNAPEHLPPLAAAVEVACYRIVQEALTNVIRHAYARTCTIHLTIETQLILEVIDDGQGLPPAVRRGAGLNSMRERAEELGGTCELLSGSSGGVRVRACLPLSEEMNMKEKKSAAIDAKMNER